MLDNEIDSELGNLFNELTGFKYESKPSNLTLTPKINVTEDNITEFVMKSSETLINAGLESIADIRDYIVQGQNPDEIESLAGLITSTTNAIETLNKIVLLKKKNDSAKELKTLEIESRKEMSKSQTVTNGNINNTNVIVASRQEIFKHFINDDSSSLDDSNRICKLVESSDIIEIPTISK